jgi:hypothetical protein
MEIRDDWAFARANHDLLNLFAVNKDCPDRVFQYLTIGGHKRSFVK